MPNRRHTRDRVAVDLGDYCLGGRLLDATFDRIIPVEILDGAIFRIGRIGIELFKATAQMIGEMEFAAAIAGRFDSGMMPLDNTLGLGEAAVFFL
jgi:hypothetical protein